MTYRLKALVSTVILAPILGGGGGVTIENICSRFLSTLRDYFVHHWVDCLIFWCNLYAFFAGPCPVFGPIPGPGPGPRLSSRPGPRLGPGFGPGYHMVPVLDHSWSRSFFPIPVTSYFWSWPGSRSQPKSQVPSHNVAEPDEKPDNEIEKSNKVIKFAELLGVHLF